MLTDCRFCEVYGETDHYATWLKDTRSYLIYEISCNEIYGICDGTVLKYKEEFQFTYCKLNNVKYVHIPFFKMEHNYEKDELFEDKWEQFFNLGNDELSLTDVNTEEVTYVECMNKYFDNNKPDLYDKMRDDFRKKYFMTEKPKLIYDDEYTNVAIHDGDIVVGKIDSKVVELPMNILFLLWKN